MVFLEVISYILLGILAFVPSIILLLFCKIKAKKQKEWEEKNRDNILSKKIVYDGQKQDNTYTLTKMIEYHKNNETVKYVIE